MIAATWHQYNRGSSLQNGYENHPLSGPLPCEQARHQFYPVDDVGGNICAGRYLWDVEQSFHLFIGAACARQTIPHHALQYQLEVTITQRGQYEFAVEVVNCTDKADTPAGLQAMDLFCQQHAAIESTYPPLQREHIRNHEDFKLNC